jgi:hypothetical protein
MGKKKQKPNNPKKNKTSSAWQTYQIRVRDLFRSLGLEAEADVEMEGVRGKHAVDVRVSFQRYGIRTVWIVECKLWKTNVPKEKVLALQSIVQDLGADKGLLFSEKGFQAGAIASARCSNILLTSVAEVATQAQEEIRVLRIRQLDDELLHVFNLLRNMIWRQELRQQRGGWSIELSAPPDYISVIGKLTMFEHCLKDLKIGKTTTLIVDFQKDEPIYASDVDHFLDALASQIIRARVYAEQYLDWRPVTLPPSATEQSG